MEVAKAVGGGCCRLQMPLKLALAVGGTVAEHRLGALEGGGGGGGGQIPPFQCIPGADCDGGSGPGTVSRQWTAIRGASRRQMHRVFCRIWR